MTSTGYKQVLKFIGEAGRCYAIIKKEQPDVYARVRNRLSDCDFMLVNGALSSKGNYAMVVSILCSRGVVIWEHNRQRNDWSKPIEVEYNNKVYVGFRNNVAKEISTLTSMGYKTIQNYINIAVCNGCVVHGLSCRYKK